MPPLVTRIPQSCQRPAALGLVLVLHIVAVWLIAESLPAVQLGDEARALQVDLLRPTAGNPHPDPAIILPTFTQPQPIGVAEPIVEIEQEAQPTSPLTALDISQMLPPRPDPQHANVAPHLSGQLQRFGNFVSAILRIFVEPDGSVSDAEIVRSSGQRALDAFALGYVKTNWRFIAASIHGRRVADWTTVVVQFNGA